MPSFVHNPRGDNMSTTWDEIRVISLQKMFLIDGSEVVENDSTQSYLSAMPGAYNEAVRLLSTANRYITKTYTLQSDGLNEILSVDMKQDIPDLYELKPNGVYFLSKESEYPEEVYSYRMVGEKLYFSGESIGEYQIEYYAYPLKATSETSGDTDLQIDDDVASLIPLYIASQLYKDDDISIATTYRNEFEVGREVLIRERNGSASAEFVSKTGWW